MYIYIYIYIYISRRIRRKRIEENKKKGQEPCRSFGSVTFVKFLRYSRSCSWTSLPASLLGCSLCLDTLPLLDSCSHASTRLPCIGGPRRR